MVKKRRCGDEELVSEKINISISCAVPRSIKASFDEALANKYERPSTYLIKRIGKYMGLKNESVPQYLIRKDIKPIAKKEANRKK